jgi:hypothetical protein
MPDELTKLEALLKAGDALAYFAKGIADTHGWEYTKAISEWEKARENVAQTFTGWKGGK